jgi:hypothetical protein
MRPWGGGRARRLLQAAYVISFLCLLRIDEVLKFEMHHIEFISDTKIKLTLPFRKTHQFGGKLGVFASRRIYFLNKHGTGIKPFYLHMQAEDQAHVCPIRALAEWVQVCGINKGYVFRRIWSGDRVADLDKNTPMVSLNKLINLFLHTEYNLYRHRSSSWNCSGITSLT